MQFISLTAILALAAHITSSIAAYSITAFAGGDCHINDPTGATLTIVGANSNTFNVASCVQIPFQGQSISLTGCTSGGTVTPFADVNCITPAAAPIPDRGIVCLANTEFKSFFIKGC